MNHLLPFGLVALTAASLACADTVDVPQPVSDSGLVTVYAGQTARLNVVNVGDPGRSCSFYLSFISSAGVGFPAAPLVAVELAGGEATSLPYPIAAPGLIRAHLDFTPQLLANADLADPMLGCYRLLPTLEVLDPTGLQQVLNTAFTGIPSVEKGKKLTKVIICHKPGTPAEQTKVIPTPALRGHLRHGDTLGACS